MPIPTKFGNKNTGGGTNFEGENTCLINGKAAARRGDHYTGHPGFDPLHPHPPNPIINAAKSIIVGGRPLGFLGVYEKLRHQAIPRESDVIIGED